VIICTGDSISMCCEGAITGKPTLVTTDSVAMESYHLDTMERLITDGYVYRFTGDMPNVPPAGRLLDPTAAIGNRINALLKAPVLTTIEF